MPSRRQQIQWIREDLAAAEKYAEQDRLIGLDGRFQDGRAAGLRTALKLMGFDQ